MTYEHVAAHAGCTANEECDRLAAAEIKALRRTAKDAKMLDEEAD